MRKERRMIFKQCPICGRYMIPNMSETSGWYQCVCGYDTRSYLYTYTNHSSDFAYGKERRMARRLKDIIIHLDYEDEYKDGKVEVNIIASEPEELIRCKNCKYWNITSDGFCGITGREEPESHYCSYGERKDED
jgi:hypothetical protein